MSGGRTLGAVLAGGAARRFGSDKALAELGGIALIDHAIAALRPHCDAIVVVGRTHNRVQTIADRPTPGLGPLGGLAGALHHASGSGFGQVLSAPCDVPFPPDALFAQLQHGPAVVADHPVFGIWPATIADRLDRWLADDRPRAVRAFAAAVGARAIELDVPVRDIDTPADLALMA